MCPLLPSFSSQAKTDQILLKSINLEKWQVRSLLLTTAMWQWQSLHLCILWWHGHGTRSFGLTHAAVTLLQTDSSIKFVLDFTGCNSSSAVQTCLTSLQMWRQVEWTKMRSSGDGTRTWQYGAVATGSQHVEPVRETTVNVLSVCRVCTTHFPVNVSLDRTTVPSFDESWQPVVKTEQVNAITR